MKKLALLFFSAITSLTFAQTVTITESDQIINKIRRTGLSTTLELDEKFVSNLWKKELKEFGKTTKDGDITVIEVGSMPSVTSGNVRIYSKTEKNGNQGTIVWIAVDMGDAFITKSHSKVSSVEKILKDFGIKAYTEDINIQIADAEKAVDKASKDNDKIVKDGEKLSTNLEQNATQKQSLEKQLEENAKQKVELEAEIEQNKSDQAASTKDVEKMNKALELVKNKINLIK